MRGFLVILLYLLAAAACLHAARRDLRRPALREPGVWLALAAVATHGAWLAQVLRPLGERSLALADGASLMGLAIGAGGLITLGVPRFRAVVAVVLALAGLLAAGTGAQPPPGAVGEPGWPYAAHALLAMTAAGLFAIAAVFVIVLALQDAALRARRPGRWLAALPPVESLERALFSAVAIGMVALSIAILAGLLFVTDLFAQHLVHKTVFALAAWLIFAALLLGRWRRGWRGRQAMRYTLAGFALLALAYFGSKFVLEVLLGRHWG